MLTCLKHLMKVIGSEGNFEALALGAPRKNLLLFWGIERHAAQGRVVFDYIVLVDATEIFAHAYRVGVANLPDQLSAREYTRRQLDRLSVGGDLERFRWGSKWVTLPPSQNETAG